MCVVTGVCGSKGRGNVAPLNFDSPPSLLHPACSQFLLEKGMPGFSLGGLVKDKLGMRASNTGELVFVSAGQRGACAPPTRAL